MTETFAAGWYLCYSEDATRKTWHYFEEGQLKSLCGIAAGYQRSIGQVERVDVASWFSIEQARHCRRCNRTRRPIEDRTS